MSYVIIAPYSGEKEALYVGTQHFHTKKLIILSEPSHAQTLKQVIDDFKKFKIPVEVYEKETNWEQTFGTINELVKKENSQELLVNLGSADASTKCAATCAAFVNGIKAFDVMNNHLMVLPVLKFSYYNLLTEKKLLILKLLLSFKEEGCFLDVLAKKAKMSAPLLSYHIHGTTKVDGLQQLGLIDLLEREGKIIVKINTLGKILMNGQ